MECKVTGHVTVITAPPEFSQMPLTSLIKQSQRLGKKKEKKKTLPPSQCYPMQFGWVQLPT
jgi:hypothetical protein